MLNKKYDQPFREDLGVDDLGYRRIRMGRTIYGAKDNQVYSLVQGVMVLIPLATLKAKKWIVRNVDEVLGVEAFPYKAKVIHVLADQYTLIVNDVRYIAKNITTDLTAGLDDGVVQSNFRFDRKPEFHFTDLLIVDESGIRQVNPKEVSDKDFQAAVKSALNFGREKQRSRNLFAYQYSRSEARAYKQRRFNSTTI